MLFSNMCHMFNTIDRLFGLYKKTLNVPLTHWNVWMLCMFPID